MSQSTHRFWEGLFTGGIIGFLVGLLTAPKPGSEFRRELKENSGELYSNAAGTIDDIRERTGHTLSEVRHKGGDFVRMAGSAVSEKKHQLTNKFEELAGKSGGTLVDDVDVDSIPSG
jgi:gas vesicle protein